MNEEIILKYEGFFNYRILNKLLSDFFVYVEANVIDNYLVKKIEIIMVEMLENNYQYIQSLGQATAIASIKPVFKIIKIGGGFKLITSNPIQKTDVEQLKNTIDIINSASFKNLKEQYKKILKEGMYSDKNTAGIGLLRIAKVAKNKIEYSFRKIDNNLLYYTLEIMINPK